MKRLAELMSLAGRTALITGGAGHIGRAMAEALGELGCNLCLLDSSDERLNIAAKEVGRQCDVRIESTRVNLENERERALLPGYLETTFGRVDIVVNCASLVGDSELEGWSVPFARQSLDAWRRALEVNLTSVFHLCQILAPMLRAGGSGSIVNVSSIYGVVGPDPRLYAGTSMGNPAAYAASKGGMIQLTRWLATGLAPEVRVNCISPGGVLRDQPGAFVARYVERTPLGRMAVEEDFKGAVAFFASDLSKYVTGENLKVDGGWTAW